MGPPHQTDRFTDKLYSYVTTAVISFVFFFFGETNEFENNQPRCINLVYDLNLFNIVDFVVFC